MSVQIQSPSAALADDSVRRRNAESSVHVALRTDAAYRLVIGRRASDAKPHIIGLFAFADLLRSIWDAAKNGDLYACWWLLKAEASLAKALADVRAERTAVRQTLLAQTSFKIDVPGGHELRRIDLLFACPYAYHGARLVKQFDSLAAELDVAVQIGTRRKSDTGKLQRRCERAIRHTFSTAQGFRDFGLTRDALERREQNAIDAEAKMGPLPTEVLSGTRWPSLLDRNDPPVTAKNSYGRS